MPEPVWITLPLLSYMARRARSSLAMYVRVRVRPRFATPGVAAALQVPRDCWMDRRSSADEQASREALLEFGAHYLRELKRRRELGPDRALFALLVAWTFLELNGIAVAAPQERGIRAPDWPRSDDILTLAAWLRRFTVEHFGGIGEPPSMRMRIYNYMYNRRSLTRRGFDAT